MTEPRSTAHLDDEALSLVLDGEEGRTAEAHVASCPSCSARLTELSAARDAVRAATVAALAPPTLDDLVSRALAATGTATGVSGDGDGDGDGNDGDRATAAPGDPVVPLARARGGRQVRTPPPAWVVSAVAALAAIVGVAALLRTGGSVADRVASGAATESEADTDTDTDAGRAESTSGDAATATVAANDPELVAGDLGDVADAPGLSSALAAMPGLLPRSAAAGGQTQGSGAADAAAADEEASPAPAPPATTTASPVAGGGAPAAAGGAAGPPDRTRCRSEMERMGASRFGALLTTATLRWAGQPAEVLVYTLTEPTGGFTRQALVLARPGCALLADLRL